MSCWIAHLSYTSCVVRVNIMAVILQLNLLFMEKKKSLLLAN